MSLSTLPLCYCTNVHPGRTLAEVEAGLDAFAVPIREAAGGPLAVGLWLADAVTRELVDDPDARQRLRDGLADRGLSCHTLNAFPFGDFHGERVKHQVYLPDWSAPGRLEYTLRCCEILADLLPDGREGSVSTLPLGFKPSVETEAFVEECESQLLAAARWLDELHDRTGRVVRLAIEPEPFCRLETTDEALAFFRRLRERAEREESLGVANEHLGLCYDVCHQAVEFEDAADSIARLRADGVRINKVHVSCAVELEDPRTNADGRAALCGYVEPRYLHQTFGRTPAGEILRLPDLTLDVCENPPAAFYEADRWRIHFHVPVNETAIGPLKTTRPQLEAALAAVAGLDYAPHLEIETYTWGVLPAGGRPPVVEGIAAEVKATRKLLAETGPKG